MTALTEQQEETLTRVMRSRWALILRKERNIFRQDIKKLHDWFRHDKGNFINKSKISCDKLYKTDLTSLTILMNNLSQKLTRTDTALEIEFDFDSEENGYDGIEYGTIQPFAHVFHHHYSFSSLSVCKKRINGNIKNTIRDAQFKFQHQFNGKDVKRYLTIIEKEERKTLQ
jgi:hypothetical protein